jgi:hypothetical protein
MTYQRLLMRHQLGAGSAQVADRSEARVRAGIAADLRRLERDSTDGGSHMLALAREADVEVDALHRVLTVFLRGAPDLWPRTPPEPPIREVRRAKIPADGTDDVYYITWERYGQRVHRTVMVGKNGSLLDIEDAIEREKLRADNDLTAERLKGALRV